MPRPAAALPALCLVAACASGGTGEKSETLFLDASGNFRNEITADLGDVVLRDGLPGEGYAYEVGVNDRNNGFAAQSGILPDTDLGAPPASGTVDMAGTFEVRTYENPRVIDEELRGDSLRRSQPITLTVDFSQGTITGAASGLSVDGEVRGSEIGGDVTFQGIEGDLNGLVGPDDTVGAFAGETDQKVFAGGFIVSR